MKKTLLFAAGLMALAMGFFSCEQQPTTTTQNQGENEPEGWYIKVDSDPEKFSVTDSQPKFQFQLTHFDYSAESVITFSFIPCSPCMHWCKNHSFVGIINQTKCLKVFVLLNV